MLPRAFWCLAIVLAGCATPPRTTDQPGAATLRSLRATTVRDFNVLVLSTPPAGAPKTAAPPAHDELRAKLLRDLRDASAERRRGALAEASRIKQAGGLRAYWSELIERYERTPLPPAPDIAARRLRLDQVVDRYRRWISELAVCQKPEISGVKNGEDEEQSVRAGEWIVIYGCKLGKFPGKARLYSSTTGREFGSSIFRWEEDVVGIELGSADGILDQPGVLSLETETGEKTNSVPILIRPRLDVRMVGVGPLHPYAITAGCSDNTDYDLCVTLYNDEALTEVVHSIGAVHISNCCFNAVSGQDRFTLNLKNGWVLHHVAPPWNHSGINCNSRWAGQPGKVEQPTGYTIGAATTTIDVGWWADSNCSYAKYLLDIYIVGPESLPY